MEVKVFTNRKDNLNKGNVTFIFLSTNILDDPKVYYDISIQGHDILSNLPKSFDLQYIWFFFTIKVYEIT